MLLMFWHVLKYAVHLYEARLLNNARIIHIGCYCLSLHRVLPVNIMCFSCHWEANKKTKKTNANDARFPSSGWSGLTLRCRQPTIKWLWWNVEEKVVGSEKKQKTNSGFGLVMCFDIFSWRRRRNISVCSSANTEYLLATRHVGKPEMRVQLSLCHSLFSKCVSQFCEFTLFCMIENQPETSIKPFFRGALFKFFSEGTYEQGDGNGAWQPKQVFKYPPGRKKEVSCSAWWKIYRVLWRWNCLCATWGAVVHQRALAGPLF